jgi:hypothetical protein
MPWAVGMKEDWHPPEGNPLAALSQWGLGFGWSGSPGWAIAWLGDDEHMPRARVCHTKP